MRHPRTLGLLASPALALIVGACFEGEATIGAICRDAGDCGPDQGCRHELCGRCGDGEHAEREVCYGDRAAIASAGAVASMHVADLDADGRDDVTTVAPDGAAAVLLAESGTFERTPLASPLSGVVASALGDVDDDGDVDVALAAGTQVAIARNDGAAGFAFDPELLAFTDDVVELGLAPAGQGTPARVLAIGEAGSLWFMPLVPGAAATELDVGTDAHLGPVFYWNDDELADVAVVDHRTYRLTIASANADGYTPAVAVEVDRGPVGVVGVDRNGDGRLDFLTIDREGHSVTIVDGTRDLGLARFDTLAFDVEPTSVSAVDADLDGRLDILVGTHERLELWRAIGGRYPEGVELSKGAVLQLGVGRFRATSLLDVLVVEGDALRRSVVTP